MTEPTREMKRNYWVLIASMVSLQVTSSTIYMVMPVFFSNYGISMSDNGYLIAVGTFAGVVSAFLAGKYSDTHGRKPILLGGAVVYAIVFFLFAALSKDYATFLILRFIEGFAYYVTPVAITAMAADIFPPGQRGKAMALYTMSNGVGQLIGPIIAGPFIDAADFNTYFLFCGGSVAVSALIIFFLAKETLPHEVRERGLASGVKGWSVAGFAANLRGLGLVLGIFFVAIVIYRTGYTMVNPFFSIYLKDVLDLNMTSTSYFFAVRALMTLVFAPVAGFMADRFGRKPAFLLGTVILIATMVGYSRATAFEHVLLLRALESISNAILTPTTRAYVADLLTPENRGFGTGLYMTLVDESSTMGAVFGGWIADLYDFSTIFVIGAATAAVCLAIVLVFVPEPRKMRGTDGAPGSRRGGVESGAPQCVASYAIRRKRFKAG